MAEHIGSFIVLQYKKFSQIHLILNFLLSVAAAALIQSFWIILDPAFPNLTDSSTRKTMVNECTVLPNPYWGQARKSEMDCRNVNHEITSAIMANTDKWQVMLAS